MKKEKIALKEWLLLKDAADQISPFIKGGIVDSDIIQLGLDKKLVLSVTFINGVSFTPCKFVPTSDLTYSVLSIGEGHPLTEEMSGVGLESIPDEMKENHGNEQAKYRIVVDNSVLELPDGHLVSVTDTPLNSLKEDVFDLPMIGGERVMVERLFQELTNSSKTSSNLEGDTFIKGNDDIFYRLETRDNAPPVMGLPEGSKIIVRTSVLLEYMDSLKEESGRASEEKKLDGREKKSLLLIIAALADKAQLQLSHKDTAGTLEKYMDRKGFSIRAESIRKHIRAAEQAAESAKKLE